MTMKPNIELKQYDQIGEIEVGLDEAGRGCLFGPVCISGVIWPKEDPKESMIIKDSKRCTEKYRLKCFEYIKDNAVSYSIQMIDNNEIDTKNILQCSIEGMHKCLNDITRDQMVDTILVDGNHFNTYYCSTNDQFIDHKCIIKGDNKYKSIAAASILAKTYRDNYIIDLVNKNPELKKYGIERNKGYGTKEHMDAIKEYGITKWHRRSFAPCKMKEIIN
ncbi:ribonuclease HII [Candidatus Poribacteria bacterium]|nr:ribonuclease HII [Candidatus Poribacteria bacterium]